MKKIIITAALLALLPVLANAEETAAAKPAPKEHHMQNSNPSNDAVPAPEHVMKNDSAATAAKAEAKKAPEHHMQNN